MEVFFDDFDPGEIFKFSADIDPTSIQGAPPPGPEDSGSVSGFELAGATATVQFDDGSSFSNKLARTPFATFASEAVVDASVSEDGFGFGGVSPAA